MLVATGQRVSVEAAKMLVETQLKYARDLAAAKARESQVIRQLNKMDLDYGDRVRVSGFRDVSTTRL